MKYFFAGIKGSGMSALATMLYDLGNEVEGYDSNADYTFTEDELIKRNIKIYYDAKHINNKAIFIYTSAIHKDNPIFIKAKEMNLTIYSYYEAIGLLSKQFETISICGCHGKTTTTAILSKIISNTKHGANYLIGDGTGIIDKKSKILILESCEYYRHFLEYNPKYIVITNIELDHIDYYKNIDDYRNAYQEFIDKECCEKVIACGDDENIRKLRSKKIIYYGLNDNNNIVAKNVISNNDGNSFDVYINNAFFGHFKISLYGKHMLLNALATIGICFLYKISPKEIEKNIHLFKGAKRRFHEEIIGNRVLIDDYAHHPTEVKVTLLAARQKYPNKKLIAILKIHTLSRAQQFKNDFIDALNIADVSYVMDIYNDRENPIDYPEVNHNMIINGLHNGYYINENMSNILLKYDNAVFCFLSSKNIQILENNFKKDIKNNVIED